MQPFPPADYERLGRVTAMVAETLHLSSLDDDKRDRIHSWIHNTIRYLSLRGPWWFLQNGASVDLAAGEDVIDIVGHVGRLGAFFAPQKLVRMSFERITELRAVAEADSLPNAGEPGWYAIEAGRRVHLWPAPDAAVTFSMTYERPIDISLLPLEWDTLIHDGAMGLFGRHFDKSGLVEDPKYFEARFREQIMLAKNDATGPEITSPFCIAGGTAVDQGGKRARTRATVRSATDCPVSYVTPVSLTGIGYVSIDVGSYPWTVGGSVEGDEKIVETC